jgi:predicted DNA repair protein MutK
MASGLFALLDDVAAIAKLASASVDDIAGNAAKAGSKAAGVVIDDAAVTPKYVTGFDPARELPIIWRIARGSLINKLVFLLPAALVLSAFASWAIPPLLIAGGLYLCFEGAEKIAQATGLHHPQEKTSLESGDPAHLEETKVRGAIKTDFILSAEIMVIALSVIDVGGVLVQAVTLAVVGIAITALVYGAVAVIVKLDDIGMWLARSGTTALPRAAGRGLVRLMPIILKALAVIGTAAMLWVGGSIIVHSLAEMGWHGPEGAIEGIGERLAAEPFGVWIVTAALDGVLGLLLGSATMPLANRVIAPAIAAVRP